MKILMFGWELPPFNSGGLGVACYGLGRALTSQGVEVIFVLPYKLPIQMPFLKLIFASSFPYLTKLPSAYTSSKQLKKPQILGRNLVEEVYLYAKRAAEIAKAEKFDLIHAHDWLSFPAGMAAKNVSGKPLIVHIHATEFDRNIESVNPDVFKIEKEGMEKADKVITVSNFTKQIVVDKYGIEPDKVTVVWNGIDQEDFPRSHDKIKILANLKKEGLKIVLFVGRITLQKGPDYFLQAAKRVLEYNPQVRFVIAGSGDMEGQIIDQAVSMGISDKVYFAGFVRGDELNQLYRSADLFVLSSVSEPFGITTLESMINGTPVLVSKQSGVAEALHHALKVDFWDIDEMANQILAILEHGSLMKCLSRNGKEEVKKFSWKEAARKCLNLYKKITSK